MSNFMCDGVVREARINGTGKIALRLASKESKTQFALFLVVMRIVSVKSSRPHIQLLPVFLSFETPGDMPTECRSESRMDNATHGVSHLIMKAFIGSRGV